MKWNDYSYGIVNPLSVRGIFLGIVISIGMTNPIQTKIAIPLKNEWNSYSLWNGMDFSKNPLLFFISPFCFPAFSHPPNNAYLPRSNLVFVLSLSLMTG